MGDVRGSTSGMGKRSSSSTSTLGLHRKLVPFSEWMENSKRHYLLLQLPNFKEGEVKVEVNESAGHVTISGERQVNEENEFESYEEEDEEPESYDEKSTESESYEEEDEKPESSEEEDEEPESSDDESTESESYEEEDEEPESSEEEDEEPESSDDESTESESSDKESTESESSEGEDEEPKSSDEESTESESFEDEMYFEEKFTIPPNSDVNMITAKFEGETLFVIIPKIGAAAAEEKEKKELPEPEVENKNVQGAATENETGENKNVQGLLRPENDEEYSNKLLGNGHVLFSLENIRKWDEHEDGGLRTAMEMLSKNKRMVLTAAAAAVVAFSLGMLVSHQRFQSGGGE